MVTDGYRAARGARPVSLAAALGMSVVMVSGLVLSSPAFQRPPDKTLEATNIFLQPPPPDDPVTPDPPRHPLTPHPVRDTRIPPVDPVVPVPTDPVAPSLPAGPTGGDIGPVITIPPLPMPTPSPVLTQPTADPRYARDFQPAYPPAEQRAGRAGLVSLRVLVGVDGRVKQVERVSAASEAFWLATERQALSRWRFRPATRDGIAIEAWRAMTVRFVMPE